MRDLFILVADGTMEKVFRGFMEHRSARHRLGCGDFDFDPTPVADLVSFGGSTDAAVLLHAHEWLRRRATTHRHVIVVLDTKFPGSEKAGGAKGIKAKITQNLVNSGWTAERVCVIVIEPELESWIFTGSPHADKELGFKAGELRKWLECKGYWPKESSKPPDPKNAMKAALHSKGKQPSASIRREIIEKSSLQHCQDPSFLDLKRTLQAWFPPN